MGRLKDIEQHKRVNPHDVFIYLTQEKGLSYNKAMGMLANIKYESDFRPTITEKGVKSGGIGLFQHTGPRRKQLDNFLGGDYSNWKKQIDFALSEPDTKNYLKKEFATPEEASYWFTTKWERPKDSHEQGLKRQTWIKTYLLLDNLLSLRFVDYVHIL